MKLISISAVCYCRICWPKELARQATSSGIHFAIYLFTYAYGLYTHTHTHLSVRLSGFYVILLVIFINFMILCELAGRRQSAMKFIRRRQQFLCSIIIIINIIKNGQQQQ